MATTTEESKGVTCRCGKFTPYDAYVYAHWTIDLTLTCDCGRKWVTNHGVAYEIEEEAKHERSKGSRKRNQVSRPR